MNQPDLPMVADTVVEILEHRQPHRLYVRFKKEPVLLWCRDDDGTLLAVLRLSLQQGTGILASWDPVTLQIREAVCPDPRG